MAETRVPLSMSKWTLLGVSPLSYEIGYADTGGYLPVAIAVASSLPDPAETKFRTLAAAGQGVLRWCRLCVW